MGQLAESRTEGWRHIYYLCTLSAANSALLIRLALFSHSKFRLSFLFCRFGVRYLSSRAPRPYPTSTLPRPSLLIFSVVSTAVGVQRSVQCVSPPLSPFIKVYVFPFDRTRCLPVCPCLCGLHLSTPDCVQMIFSPACGLIKWPAFCTNALSISMPSVEDGPPLPLLESSGILFLVMSFHFRLYPTAQSSSPITPRDLSSWSRPKWMAAPLSHRDTFSESRSRIPSRTPVFSVTAANRCHRLGAHVFCPCSSGL